MLPINYFSELVGLITDTTIILSLVEELFPKLKNFFKENARDISISNFVHKWLISLFTQNVSDDVCTLIWDLFFLEGNVVLIQASIIMFSILEDQLLNNQNKIRGLFNILDGQLNMPKLLKFFLHHFKRESFLYEPDELKSIQLKVKEFYITTYKKNEPDIVHVPLFFDNDTLNKECDPNYPHCLKMEEIEIKKEGIEFLVFSTRQCSINLIEGYYFDKNKCEGRREGFYSQEVEEDCLDVLVERRKHLCGKSGGLELTEENIRKNSDNNNNNNDDGVVLVSDIISDMNNQNNDYMNQRNNLKRRTTKEIEKIQRVVAELDPFAPKKFHECVETQYDKKLKVDN